MIEFILVAMIAIWCGSESGLARSAGWPASWRDIAAMAVRDALLPAIRVATFARRGTDMEAKATPAA